MSLSLQIKKLTPTIGAQIKGLNLSAQLDQATMDQIYQALIEHLVIYFPQQELSAESHLSFAETFGIIDQPHSIYPHVGGLKQVVLLENDGNRPPDTNDWHTDLTFKKNPPFASILQAKVIPETGGDTLWANMYTAYNELPSHMKEYLSGLKAIHDMGSFRNGFIDENTSTDRLNEAMMKMGSAVHPVVQVHPVTNKPFLYINKSFTTQICGMSTSESDRLLGYLYDHINQPEFQIRYTWSTGDVAMWDNRVTQHYAVADYAPHYRRMHRVTVVNDKRAKTTDN